MTIDPGAKQDVEAWTTFTASADIPDWISKAYIDSYRGPRDDSSEATKAAEASWLPASLLTPAMLGAHYRLGRHRAPVKAVSPSIGRTIPRGSVRRCRWSPSTAAC